MPNIGSKDPLQIAQVDATSSETKRNIMLALLEQPMSQAELSDKLAVSHVTVSRHLRQLINLEMVKVEEARSWPRVYQLVIVPQIIANQQNERR